MHEINVTLLWRAISVRLAESCWKTGKHRPQGMTLTRRCSLLRNPDHSRSERLCFNSAGVVRSPRSHPVFALFAFLAIADFCVTACVYFIFVVSCNSIPTKALLYRMVGQKDRNWTVASRIHHFSDYPKRPSLLLTLFFFLFLFCIADDAHHTPRIGFRCTYGPISRSFFIVCRDQTSYRASEP